MRTAALFPAGFAPNPSEFVNISAQNLRKWRNALARAKTGGNPAKIALVGDSTTLGCYSSGSPGTNLHVNSYGNQLASMLSIRLMQAQANSFFGDGTVGTTLPTSDPRVTISGSWGASGTIKSLGGAILQTNAAGTLTFTPTANCKSFDIWYLTNSGLGIFTADIGGAGTITVNTNTTIGVQKATITAASASLSPLNINYSSGGYVCILGVEGKNTTDLISVWNMGRSGSKIADWVASTSSPWDCLQALPTLAPDLSIICLTINDWVANTAVGAYMNNMQSLINAAKSSGDVLLMIGVPSNTVNAAATNQASIVQANYALSAQNNLPLLDLTQRWKDYTTSNGLGMYYDGLHPDAVGYADVAAAVAKAIAII